MRQIKFRVWNIALKRWVKPSLTMRIDGNMDGMNDYVLLQYTGLKDKTGVDVYEGDLVKFFGIENPCTIEFQDGGFGYNCHQKYSEFTSISGHNYLFDFLETVEVIGNIYENPELLEKK